MIAKLFIYLNNVAKEKLACPPLAGNRPFRPSKRGHSGRGVWGEFRHARAESNCGQPRRSA